MPDEFAYRVYQIFVTPKELPDGRFEAQAVIDGRNASGVCGSFSALGTFADRASAAAHAQEWITSWIDNNLDEKQAGAPG